MKEIKELNDSLSITGFFLYKKNPKAAIMGGEHVEKEVSIPRKI